MLLSLVDWIIDFVPIFARFKEDVESGLIEIVAPSASFYPDLKTIKSTLGDSEERTRWRTKQNLDCKAGNFLLDHLDVCIKRLWPCRRLLNDVCPEAWDVLCSVGRWCSEQERVRDNHEGLCVDKEYWEWWVVYAGFLSGSKAITFLVLSFVKIECKIGFIIIIIAVGIYW